MHQSGAGQGAIPVPLVAGLPTVQEHRRFLSLAMHRQRERLACVLTFGGLGILDVKDSLRCVGVVWCGVLCCVVLCCVVLCCVVVLCGERTREKKV